MTTPPTFASIRDFRARLADVGFWSPYITEVLERHGLADAGPEPVAGIGGTHPTFVKGEVVVKLFGYIRPWRKSHVAERGALALVTTDPEIAAPRLLANGRLYDNADTPWPYMITTRMPGSSLRDVELSTEQWHTVAVEVGKQVRRFHALRPSGVAAQADWSDVNVVTAAEQSSLPPHLVSQVDEYLTWLAPFDSVFAHGDLTLSHTFVENGRLTGIIDWGDAMVSDRHYELIQPFRDLFGCDRTLFRIFLEACDWPVGDDFPRQALGLALYRQAVGLAQHHTMDVFEPIASLLLLQNIDTLDELATELFAI